MKKVKVTWSELDGSKEMFLETHLEKEDLDRVNCFLAVRKNRPLIFSSFVPKALKYKRHRKIRFNTPTDKC